MKKLAVIVGVAALIWIGVSMVASYGGLEPVAYMPAVFKPENTPTPTATLPATSTPTPTATATTAPATSTPTATPTQSPGSTGNIEIGHIHFDGSGSNEPDEYVQFTNVDTMSIQLAGWTLSDQANHVYTFPSFVIAPGQTCRVYTNESHPEWCGFNYGSGSAIWNNGGDCGTLRNASNVQIDQFCY